MIFIEVQNPKSSIPRQYLLGVDVANALQLATDMRYTVVSHREITEAEARALGVGLIDEGMEAIRQGPFKNYLLAFPEEEKRLAEARRRSQVAR